MRLIFLLTLVVSSFAQESLPSSQQPDSTTPGVTTNGAKESSSTTEATTAAVPLSTEGNAPPTTIKDESILTTEVTSKVPPIEESPLSTALSNDSTTIVPFSSTTTTQSSPTTSRDDLISSTLAAESSTKSKDSTVAENALQTTESNLLTSTSTAIQPPQSPRNPKYVDIGDMKHPEEQPPDIASKPFPHNLTVRLENLACEYPQYQRPGLQIDVEKTFKQLSENISSVAFVDTGCKMFLTMNVTVTATNGDFKKLLSKLEEHVKNITVGDHMIITGFTLHDSGEHQVDLRPTVTRAGRFPTYREELIILIAVIILLIIVLFIACVICSIKCCRRTPSTKTLDILDAQTPGSRSMDFNTRIPRAHMLCSPTASEYSGCMSPMTPFGPGIVQPFDTCLVPLEDVMPATTPHSFSTANARVTRPSDLPIRQKVDFTPENNRFRSYNYPPKHTKALPNIPAPTRTFGGRTAVTQSTEQLTKNQSLDDDSGVDNPTYLPTPSTPMVISIDVTETQKM